MPSPPPEAPAGAGTGLLTGARHPSLRRRLLLVLMLPLLLLGAIAAAWDVVLARRLTDDAYDRALANTAIGLAVRLETDGDNDLSAHIDATMRTLSRLEAPDVWHYLVLDANGRPLAGDPALSIFLGRPAASEPFFSDAVVGGVRLRGVTYLYRDDEGDTAIVVAVGARRREMAAASIVAAAGWPNLLLMLATLLIVMGGVRHVLRPLDALGARLARTRAQDLVPVATEQTPRETLPLVTAVNDLMARLRAAADAQQGFLNQTAHQLRTPLAALQAQLDLLRDTLPADQRSRIAAPLASAKRLSHLTHQLLALARSEPGAAVVAMGPVDLMAVCEDLATPGDDLARQRGIELDFEVEPAVVTGSDWMLHELLSNLLDNAITHSPAGSRVQVRCGVRPGPGSSAPFLEVIDNGPGIAEADRERVFMPFVQGAASHRQGSGLGLAIVREVADRHGALVRLLPGEHGRGTCAQVSFPAPGAREGNDG